MKKYVPLTLDEAEDICNEAGVDLDEMTDADRLIYAEILKVHQRIDDVENQAAEMMSPEKMADLTSSFMGGGLKLG